MRAQSRTADERVAWIASRQHGNATHEQLLAAGLKRSAIARRAERGWLIRVHPGVYRVGHIAPSIEADYMAAVLACGKGAVLAGHAAAHLQRLVRVRKAPPPEVIARTERNIEGILTSRCRRMDRRDVTVIARIPMTTVPRTVVDLAGRLGASELARAVHQADALWRTGPAHVEAVLKRRPNSPGAALLREILRGGALLGQLEREFRRLLKEERLPLPVVNRRKDGHYVDCRWPDHRLTVELTSFRYHNTRQSWEDDRQRRREARARGDRFREYTWYDVVEHSGPTRAEMRRLLGR